MNIEALREYCISIKGATECFPFDETTLVFKVMNKMFAYIGLEPKDGDFFVNLKCNPEKAIELRQHYEGIKPGYHSSKKHWNSIYLHSDVPDKLLKELIDHSVEEVIKNLAKKQQEIYKNS